MNVGENRKLKIGPMWIATIIGFGPISHLHHIQLSMRGNSSKLEIYLHVLCAASWWNVDMCSVHGEQGKMYNVKCTHFGNLERRPAFKYNKNPIELEANPNEQYFIYMYVCIVVDRHALKVGIYNAHT